MQDKRIRRSRWRPPTDLLVLAAVDRAQRHRQFPEHGDPTLSEIAAHLGMAWGPHASRRLHPLVDRLTHELGWLERSRRVSQDRWGVTDAGAERLARASVDGVLEELPESPQHREWREARAQAAARIERLQSELGELLAKVGRLLDADDPVPASEWLARRGAAARSHAGGRHRDLLPARAPRARRRHRGACSPARPARLAPPARVGPRSWRAVTPRWFRVRASRRRR